MSFVKDTLTPVFTVAVILGFFAWILYMIRYAFKKKGGNLNLWLRYKVFGKQPDEVIVTWCLEANQLDYTVEKVRSMLLIKGHRAKVVDEICYIYTMVRQMKGGLKKDEQRIRESDLKTLPEI